MMINENMKVLSLVGARPQFIKEAILHKVFMKHGVNEFIINSGQHYDFNMSDMFFNNLKIKKPIFNLNVGSGSHALMTGKILIEFENILNKINPDIVLVYGDTNTTLAGALTAAKLKYKVAHVEAGLRSKPYNMPEEINRVLVDHISDFLFCPSKLAEENLHKENVVRGVYFSGDVMLDLYNYKERNFSYDFFKFLKLEENKYVVVTIHRDYNVDNFELLETILIQLNKINSKIKVVFTIHPRTKNSIKKFKLSKLTKKLLIIEPLDYLNLMGLVKKSWKVITDSGGLQKESYFSGKRSIVLMPDTCWKELILHKINILAKPDELYDKTFLENEKYKYENIYGYGNAGEIIVKTLLHNL